MKNQKASKIDGHYSIRAGANNQWFRTEKGKRIISSVIQRKKDDQQELWREEWGGIQRVSVKGPATECVR